jgi:uncharacterized protein (TIGR02271 family)
MRPESERDDATGPSPTDRGPEPSDGSRRDPDTLRLWEEEVSFDRERVETGRVRVRVVTREHDETVETPLARETFEIDRVPVGREIEAMPAPRQEGDVTILPVVEEVMVVQRKLVLKEELHLRRVRTTEQHRETVRLRRQEAVVERLPVDQRPTDPKPD